MNKEELRKWLDKKIQEFVLNYLKENARDRYVTEKELISTLCQQDFIDDDRVKELIKETGKKEFIRKYFENENNT
ncbi:MAG: hypothetical protein ABIH65_03655 [Nanoarchaeota archaeon]